MVKTFEQYYTDNSISIDQKSFDSNKKLNIDIIVDAKYIRITGIDDSYVISCLRIEVKLDIKECILSNMSNMPECEFIEISHSRIGNLIGFKDYKITNLKIEGSELDSLEGLPSTMYNLTLFNINNLKDLKGCPYEIKEDLQLITCTKLTSLEGIAKSVDSLSLSNLPFLESLEHCPEKLGEFSLSTLNITSLEHGPTHVKDGYSITSCFNIETLENLCENFPEEGFSVNGTNIDQKFVRFVKNDEYLKDHYNGDIYATYITYALDGLPEKYTKNIGNYIKSDKVITKFNL